MCGLGEAAAMMRWPVGVQEGSYDSQKCVVWVIKVLRDGRAGGGCLTWWRREGMCWSFAGLTGRGGEREGVRA